MEDPTLRLSALRGRCLLWYCTFSEHEGDCYDDQAHGSGDQRGSAGVVTSLCQGSLDVPLRQQLRDGHRGRGAVRPGLGCITGRLPMCGPVAATITTESDTH